MVVLVVALQRMIAGGVTIHAPWMGEDFADFAEDRLRTLGLVRNGGEFGRAFEGLMAVWLVR
jgi:hypothetical protein